uniref:Uncharacterized protein n=1 Tax=Brassica oleracea TaxID=3712 RepID=A0A3P6FE94_BRAOL|nr:unnamed protein product [Brassica oleracea]
MASGQNEEFSVKAGQNVGQAQVSVDNNTNSSQTSGFLQQNGGDLSEREKVKSMAQKSIRGSEEQTGDEQ